MRSSRRLIAPILPVVLSLACLVVSAAGLLPHFHDAADGGHAASCVLHQAASATQAALAADPVRPERLDFLWSVVQPHQLPLEQSRSLRNGLRGPPVAIELF